MNALSLLLRIALMLIVFNASTYIVAKERATDTAVDDARIRTDITSKYAFTPGLSPINIAISVQQGEVILSGNIHTQQQYNQAVAIALDTRGVDSVNAEALIVKANR
jgi:osmotically-inducible protein OsmY